jgi:hypothetical protein
MRLRFLAIAVALLFVAGHSSAQNPTLKTAMRDKLGHTHRLLEAIVTEDFAKMARAADALGRISQTEVVSWQAAPSAEYRKQATAFILSVQGLRDAVAKKSLDAAAAEYTNLVSSCTHCHAHVKHYRTVSVDR